MLRMLSVFSIAVFAAAGCVGMKSRGSVNECYAHIPRDMQGLVIDGPRPRRNVIENLAPIFCTWRKQCLAQQRADLTGTIVLKLVVDKVGDIGIVGYTSTIRDSAFVEQLVSGLFVLDFDPWNDQPEETRITVPLKLVK